MSEPKTSEPLPVGVNVMRWREIGMSGVSRSEDVREGDGGKIDMNRMRWCET